MNVYHLVHDGNGIYFYQGIKNQSGNLDGGAGGTGRGEVAVSDFAEFIQVTNVPEVDGKFDNIPERGSGGFKGQFHVFKGFYGLGFKTAGHDVSLLITGGLAGHLYGVTHFYRLCKVLRFPGSLGRNEFPFQTLTLSRFPGHRFSQAGQ